MITETSLLQSHLWRRLRVGSTSDQRCYYCEKIIPARTQGTWKYGGAYRIVYGCPHHRLPKVDVKCHHCEVDKNCLEHGIRR